MKDMKVGQRVMLVDGLHHHPLGYFPQGSAGTVMCVYEPGEYGDTVAEVLMDDHFPALDEWANFIHVGAVGSDEAWNNPTDWEPVT